MSELELLRDAFASVPEPSVEVALRARARLEQAIDRSTVHPSLRARIPRRIGRRTGMAIALAAAAALALAGVLGTRGESRLPAADAAVRACAGSGPAGGCLAALARVAADANGTGRIVYQRLLYTLLAPIRVVPVGSGLRGRPLGAAKRPFIVDLARPRETWVDTMSYQAVVRTGTYRLWFPTPEDRLAWMEAGSPSWRKMAGWELPSLIGQPAGAGPFEAAGVRRVKNADTLFFLDLPAWQHVTGATRPSTVLPTDPGRALALLRAVWAASHGHSAPAQPQQSLGFRTVDDIPFRDPLLRPAQRAALIAALSHAGGVRRETLAGPDGRPVTAVIVPASKLGPPALHWVILFDPRTSRVVAEGVQGAEWRSQPGKAPWPDRLWIWASPAQHSGLPAPPIPSPHGGR